jgi:polyferredoxin
MVLGELADMDLVVAEVEGVSGATMTSLAVAEGLVRAADEHREATALAAGSSRASLSLKRHDFGAAVTILAGLVIGLTRLRSKKTARLALRLVLIAYLGLTTGTLLSQAMVVGWAQNGIPWRSAPGLVLLSAAAFLVPLVSRRNIYCSHLCPHGAAQQLLRRRLPWRLRLGRRTARLLTLLPALLLAWCVAVPLLALPFSLIDIEPFDAWVFRVAGWATIAIAIVGLSASLFVPMAYCRYGCPTGALLNFVRRRPRSERWTPRDWLAVGLAVLAAGVLVI